MGSIYGVAVFIMQPTGSRKTFIFQPASTVPVTVVVLTQTSLMKRQVEFLKSMGITAKFTSEDQGTKRPKMLFKGRDYTQIVLGPANSNSIIMSHVAFTDMCFWKLTSSLFF